MKSLTQPRYLGALILLFLSACTLPEGDDSSPEGAYYRWVQARQSGDVEGCWTAMHPEVRGHLTRWNEVERETLFIVETIYPKERRAAALEILEDGGRVRLPDAKALFAHLMARGSEQALEGLQAFGARVADVEPLDDESVLLSTRGGNKVTLRRVDESWSVSLSESDMAKLEESVKRAEANLTRAQANVKRLRGVD